MAVKRKVYYLRKGDVIEVEENHDGRYGAPGEPRRKKRVATKDEIQRINAANRAKRCRHRLLEYFNKNDIFATLEYLPDNRPETMQEALQDFKRFREKIGRRYKKHGCRLFWIRNIERGTRGRWHIHLVINETGQTMKWIEECWDKGGVWITRIGKSKYNSPDMAKLANYLTKDENTREKKKDGTPGRPRLKEANYRSSRNMPLPEPRVDRIKRWREEPRPKKGYFILSIYEGINPVTHFLYRRYTMMRGEENGKKKGEAG